VVVDLLIIEQNELMEWSARRSYIIGTDVLGRSVYCPPEIMREAKSRMIGCA
jgi:hypothetical protein